MTSGENAIVTTVLRSREQRGGGVLDYQQFTVKDVEDFLDKEGKPYDKTFLSTMLRCLSREGLIKLDRGGIKGGICFPNWGNYETLAVFSIPD